MTSHRSRISPEARHALIVGAIALLLSSLPYLAGFAAQTPDQVFDGAVFDLPDYHTHLGEMQLGRRGEWLHRILSTSEEHPGALMRTFYIALGHLARLSDWPLPLVYQLARVVFGALLLLAAYRFIAALTDRPEVRRAAFLLAAFSSGLGWLVQIAAPAGPDGISPIDFWLIDANTFFSILIFPHFSAAIALLLEIQTRLAAALGHDSHAPGRREGAVVALCALLLTSIHPYAIALVLGPAVVFAAWQVIRRRGLPRRWWGLLVAALLGAAPVLVYSGVVFLAEPAFRQWAAQNHTPSPPPSYYVLGYGLVLALALAGARRFVRERGEAAAFVLTWPVIVAALVYVPIGIQRRFVEGVHVPLCVVAAYGLVGLSGRVSARARFALVTFTLAIASLSNLYLVVGHTTAAGTRSQAIFHAADLIAAIDWLGAHSTWRDTVLAAESTGSLIPARIGHRVVLGHWAETFAYDDRRRDVAAFFDAATPDAARLDALRRLGVRFVVRGAAERALGGFDPAQVDYLREVYQSGEVAVYRVEIATLRFAVGIFDEDADFEGFSVERRIWSHAPA